MTGSRTFYLTVTRALLESLDLRRILYVLLSGVTAGDGLNFNRAFLLLVDEGERIVQGECAIGPMDAAEAERIWQAMDAQEFTLERVLGSYEAWEKHPSTHALDAAFRRVILHLPFDCAADSFSRQIAEALAGSPPVACNETTLAVPGIPVPLQQFARVSLRNKDRIIGVLLVDNAFNARPIQQNELEELATLANLAAIAVERARLHERVRRLAEQDGLTGLLNRLFFERELHHRATESRAHGTPLSLLLLDLDEFKMINDGYGHRIGDEVLRKVAATLRQRIRSTDTAGRYGGDELAILLPRTDAIAAFEVAEQVRQSIAALAFEGYPRHATVSIGVASLSSDHTDALALLHAADTALYDAKRRGRNCAVLCQSPTRSLVGSVFAFQA